MGEKIQYLPRGQARELIEKAIRNLSGPFTAKEILLLHPRIAEADAAQLLIEIAKAGTIRFLSRGRPGKASVYELVRPRTEAPAEPIGIPPNASPSSVETASSSSPKPRAVKPPAPSKRALVCPSCGEPFGAESSVDGEEFDLLRDGRRVAPAELGGTFETINACFRCAKFFVEVTMLVEAAPRIVKAVPPASEAAA